MQTFKNAKEAVGRYLGQYDEVTGPYDSYEEAQDTAAAMTDNWIEANVIQVGERYHIGIRDKEQ